MFETFSIKFNNREAFNTAICFLENSKHDGFFVDVGHSDMFIVFDDKSVLNNFIAELPVSSVCFTINQ